MLAEDKVRGLREPPTAIGDRSIRFFQPSECQIPSPLVRVSVDLLTTRGTTVWPVELQNQQSTAKMKTEDQQLHSDRIVVLKWRGLTRLVGMKLTFFVSSVMWRNYQKILLGKMDL